MRDYNNSKGFEADSCIFDNCRNNTLYVKKSKFNCSQNIHSSHQMKLNRTEISLHEQCMYLFTEINCHFNHKEILVVTIYIFVISIFSLSVV